MSQSTKRGVEDLNCLMEESFFPVSLEPQDWFPNTADLHEGGYWEMLQKLGLKTEGCSVSLPTIPWPD